MRLTYTDPQGRDHERKLKVGEDIDQARIAFVRRHNPDLANADDADVAVAAAAECHVVAPDGAM